MVTKPEIQDNYFKMPRIIETLGLSPHAYRLYGHIKSITGEDGSCWQNGRTLAAACHLSTGYISLAKRELVDKGLILVTKKVAATAPRDLIKVVGVWHENHAMWHQENFSDGHLETVQTRVERLFKPPAPPQLETVQTRAETVQTTSPSPARDCSNHVADEQGIRSKKQEEQERERAAQTKFAKGFQALRDIPKYRPEPKRDARLVQFLEDNEISGDTFFRSATALSAAWPPRTSKNPDPWLSVRTYCLNCVKWDAERAGTLGRQGQNGRFRRVEARSDPADFSNGFWGDEIPGPGSPAVDQGVRTGKDGSVPPAGGTLSAGEPPDPGGHSSR